MTFNDSGELLVDDVAKSAEENMVVLQLDVGVTTCEQKGKR